MPAAFWGPDRLLLRSGGAWRVLSWPDGRELGAGEGAAVPEPGGPRLAVLDAQGRIAVDGRGVIPAPPRTPVREIAWDGPAAILAACGLPALHGPFNPGPALLPVPEVGCTAQRFGDHPAEGMSLWRLPLDGGPPECLVRAGGLEQIGRPVSLGPAGVAYQHYRYPAYGAADTQRVLRVPGSGGPPGDLAPDLPGSTAGLAPAPDGRTWALLHSTLEPFFPFWYRLVLLRGRTYAHPLPAEIRLTGEAPVWSPDGGAVAVTAFQGIRVGIAVVEIGGVWRWLGPVEGACRGAALAPLGAHAVADWESPEGGPALSRFGAGRRPPLAPAGAARPAPGGVRFRLMRWTHAGAALEGVLAVPPGAGPRPLVVDLHGGPVNGLRAGRQPDLERWCAHGFAAFAPDHRGSGIAGQEAMAAAARAEEAPDGGSEAGDVLAGVDALVREGVADPGALFLFGHSHGAHLVNRIVTRDHRFRAAVAFEGHADARLAFLLGWGGGGLHSSRVSLGGNPWQAPARYAAASPVTDVARVRTPLLLLHGDHETAEAVAWYTALREHGAEVELVFYRGEGHIPLRPENRADIVARSVAWFRAHGGAG